jgi:hypothetical protein
MLIKLLAFSFLVISLSNPTRAEGDPWGCTVTQGFWKTHPDAWWVESLSLGSVSYTKAQLLQILDEPVRGNGLISLAHQFIATLLNVAAGADGGEVQLSIWAANDLIGDQVVPPFANSQLHPRDTSAIAAVFAAFNEGSLFPEACENGPPPPPGCVGDLQTHATSWVQQGINDTARITGPICSESGTFNISVFGTQVGVGASFGSFVLYEGLDDWAYDTNHLFQPDPECTSSTTPPCVDANGLIFGADHSAVFSFSRASGTHRYTYVYGVRGFGHGFFDAHGEIFVVVP